MYRITAKVCALIMLLGWADLSANAQQNLCDLKLKVYSYDALEAPKSRLRDVRVRLRGKRADKTMNLGVSSLDNGFAGLTEGRYDLEFSKAGYKERRKTVDLRCVLRDVQNAVWNHTYLWRDKKVPAAEADLVEDAKDDSSNVRGAAGIGSPEVTRAAEARLVGKVTLHILIDVDGNVVSASRVDGDKNLAPTALKAALRAKFSPTIMSGAPVQVSGNITYNFVP